MRKLEFFMEEEEEGGHIDLRSGCALCSAKENGKQGNVFWSNFSPKLSANFGGMRFRFVRLCPSFLECFSFPELTSPKKKTVLRCPQEPNLDPWIHRRV